jgi:dipeptidase E
VLSKNLSASRAFIYGDGKKAEISGLGYVDFYVRPHLNSPHFPNDRDEVLKKLAKKFDGDLYAIDDNSAIVYNKGKLEVISEGKWIKYSHN